MKKGKKLVCGLLAAALLACLAPAGALAAGENYVEVVLTVNPEYAAQGHGAAGRIAAAEQVMSAQFNTLNEAQAAFQKLYAAGEDGNYTGTKDEGDLNGYVNANPFYYRASDAPSDVDKRPVQAVEFIVHGTVPAGSEQGIQLGSGQGFVVNDVKLTGAQGAGVITQAAGFWAKVAGGYEETFVTSGTFTVSGIDFQCDATQGTTSIAAEGGSYNTPGNTLRADSVTVTIQNCKFHNQLYFYTNDGHVKSQNLTIRECEFTGTQKEGGYAIFVQPDQRDQGQASSVVIEKNKISNYDRGINVQARYSAVVDIRENTIDGITGAGKEAVQITTCKTASVTGNTIRNVAGNVLRVHSLANQVVQQVNVEENTIEQSAYLLWDQTAGAADVTFARNEIAADVDRVHGYDKKNDQLVDSSPDMAGDALNITVTWFDGVQGPRTQVVQGGWGKPLAKPADPVRAGYVFGGWYADAACTTPFSFSAAQKADVAVYAKWTQNSQPNTGSTQAKQNPKTGA